MKIDFLLTLMVYHRKLVHLSKNKIRWQIGHLSKTRKSAFKNIIYTSVLTLSLHSLLVPTPYIRGGGSAELACYLKTCCPNEREILWGIRDIFERFRNVKVG